MGVFYDDNVPAIPAESNDPFIRDLRRRRRESTGELGAVRFDYSLFRRSSLATTVTYFHSSARSTTTCPDSTSSSHLVGLTTTYQGTVAGLPVYLSVPYSYDYFTLGDDPFVQRHIVAPSVSLAEGSSHFTTLQARYMNKDFFDKPEVLRDDKRDATNSMLGIGHLVRFERDRHLVRLGYR